MNSMYPDTYSAGVIGFNIQTDSEEAVTITLTIVGSDNVVFVIDRYEQYEISMHGMVLSFLVYYGYTSHPHPRHCEEMRDEAIQTIVSVALATSNQKSIAQWGLDCFVRSQ